MKIDNVNPFSWGEQFMNQGRVISGETRTLFTSGQIAWQDDANSPVGISEYEPGNFRAQFERALWSLDQVLTEADMSRDDIQHIKFYVTDIDAAMANLDVMMDYLGDNRPPQSLIGVAALVLPGLMIEIEAVAVK
ncbi:RidA family protein [Pseudohoeflea coraliihabitans]|uniref:RidA family protein n=1 Tax=Pseudohoeflea coraliihabitans TaxID=2860393 RepID=A0ABS6WM37_9HYPH|nr:RidA family protein [Pseudohoeflea sp. DP4N28-3]MBW3097031.1 RidA family protein [Pseudohoeflea sp. DP4N28-3]